MCDPGGWLQNSAGTPPPAGRNMAEVVLFRSAADAAVWTLDGESIRRVLLTHVVVKGLFHLIRLQEARMCLRIHHC